MSKLRVVKTGDCIHPKLFLGDREIDGVSRIELDCSPGYFPELVIRFNPECFVFELCDEASTKNEK